MTQGLKNEKAGLAAICARVDANGGVQTVTMLELRDAYGAGRLGIHVQNGISSGLKSLGYAHYPQTLPAYQEEPVRLYRAGGPIDELIAAVLSPSSQNDPKLREFAERKEPEILKKIRELVCD